MDNFIVSARKYRPITFESVVGQSHITDTLRNAIARGQLAHAYLFCGPRGVGKTTCARIFAKAINCLNPQGSEACGECESCRAFNEGRSFNIHELDAASNNSVDDIRSLTEQVRIPPQIGRYSVYIIDEVHMLSQAAFNAFLKTLEEPPAHAIFILATTEKHKIIPTILSRCQIYDFNRIRVEDGVAYLRYIAQAEGITYDDESLNLIAAKADGGMRDALSMFDKAVAFCGKALNFREVARTLNVLDYDTYFNITQLAEACDYKSVLLIFDDVLRKGFSAQTFIGGLAAHLRDLLMCKDPSTVPLLEATGTLLERYRQQSAAMDIGFLFNAVALINTVDATLRSATNSRLHVELGLMKLCGLGQKKNNLEPDEPQLPPLASGTDNNAASTAPSVASVDSAGKTPANAVTAAPESAPVASGQVPVNHHVTGLNAVATDSCATQSQNSTYNSTLDSSGEVPAAHRGADVAEGRSDLPPHTVSEDTAACKPAVSQPSAEMASVAPKSGKSISGVSINSILKGGSARGNSPEANAAAPSKSDIDPDSEAKILSVRERFLEEMSRHRPRFATAFSQMKVKGNKIFLSASTDLLRDDIVQNQRDIVNLLRSLCGIDGGVEFDIAVQEDKGAVRPIKPEDKLAHLRAKNSVLDDLRRDLGLELE